VTEARYWTAYDQGHSCRVSYGYRPAPPKRQSVTGAAWVQTAHSKIAIAVADWTVHLAKAQGITAAAIVAALDDFDPDTHYSQYRKRVIMRRILNRLRVLARAETRTPHRP